MMHTLKSFFCPGEASPDECRGQAQDNVRWDALSSCVLVAAIIAQILLWPALPRFVDIYYHLSVASGFNAAGGYVTHDFWEWAPAGRPHLYPPLLHFILLALSRTGLPWITVGKIAESILTIGLLAALWFAVRSISGRRIAFFAVLAAWTAFPLHLAVGTLLPFTLALTLGLLALAALDRGRFIAAGIFLGLGFYSHLMMGGVCLAACLLYTLLSRGLRGRGFAACAIAVTLAAPLLWYEWVNRTAFGFVQVRESRSFQIDPIVHGLALAGLVLTLRRCGRSLAPVCLAAAMMALLPTHRVRFISGHGMIAAAWLAALAPDWVWTRMSQAESLARRKPLILAGIVAIFIVFPMIHVNSAKHALRIGTRDRTPLRMIPSSTPSEDYPRDCCICQARNQYDSIAALLKANTEPDDIIWSDYSYGAGIVSLLSGRAMSSFMMLEVPPREKINPLLAAKVHIWFKSEVEDIASSMNPVVSALNMKLLEENDLAWVWLNPKPAAKTVVSPVRVPTPAAITLIILLLAGAVADMIFLRSSKVTAQAG